MRPIGARGRFDVFPVFNVMSQRCIGLGTGPAKCGPPRYMCKDLKFHLRFILT